MALLVAGCALVGTGLVSAQLPLDAIKESGQSVTAAYEGWYVTPDKKKALLIGYWNRNTKQTLDIPVGPNNRIEPGGPDMGQPTHFDPRRGWGTFSVVLPDDFGDKKLTWTLVANGKTETIPMGLHPDYVIEPYREVGMGNTPPLLKFDAAGKTFTGPPIGIAHEFTGSVGQAVPLTAWATDDGVEDPRFPGRGNKPLNVRWIVHRQPVGAEVKFDNDRPKVDKDKGGEARATASFSMPGEYILRSQGTDLSGEGGGGFQCCWTSALVKVTVK
ncbi:MAG: hypothetical protein IT178_09005 [Acidobacteria bacterium]|nr:hypothetical protein [Acidobacteriota bacterium]